MNLIYDFDLDTPDELLEILAKNLQQRRLEKGLSRNALSKLSGVPTPHDCQIRNRNTPYLWPLSSQWPRALGYSKDIKELSVPSLSTTRWKSWKQSIETKTESEDEMKWTDKLTVLLSRQDGGQTLHDPGQFMLRFPVRQRMDCHGILGYHPLTFP